MMVLEKQQCCSGEIMERVNLLARHSEMVGELTRTYLTVAHTAVASQIADWMRAAGMSVHRDAAGNVIGCYEGSDPAQPAVVTGSHFDSVRNGGKYDGNLGILLPISCIAQWHRQGHRFRFPIVVIAFADTEGVRFKSSHLGSRAVAGTFDYQTLDNLDEQGVSLRQAMLKAGFDPQHLPDAAWSPLAIKAFVEVHIEQGPLLLAQNIPVGIVTAISGATRFMVSLDGMIGHAGAVPMQLRRDAAMAAAEIGLMIERRCAGRPGLVGTVGILEIPNGAASVIPAAARFSIDIRAEHDEMRMAAVNDVLAEIGEITRKRNIKGILRKIHETNSVPCHAGLQRQLAAAVERAGLPLQYLPSGAAHDAMEMAAIADVAMLFVRCGNDGISHHPHEIMSTVDAAAAAQVFMHFIEDFD
jgi:hydantoinase/carbamoylase family amidase